MTVIFIIKRIYLFYFIKLELRRQVKYKNKKMNLLTFYYL